jgi:pimeloyl-ACP methyl ester carboxylesterase/tRNA A-37 threonylcarbamoyl transferase component Bud32
MRASPKRVGLENVTRLRSEVLSPGHRMLRCRTDQAPSAILCGRFPTGDVMGPPDLLSLDRVQRAVGARYRVSAQIGAGGMAAVYAADDARHARRVAIKVLRPELTVALGVERFEREIVIAARLQHPHILPLVDSGAAEGLCFYVMPLVDGVSLRARLAREGELPIDDSLRLLREILEALAYAHAQQIVHRDIKPENIMLAAYGTRGTTRWHALVADFGVAKAVSVAATEAALTATGVAVGTPAYMSPEQAAADPSVDHRADLYAVGILAYEMLIGTPPFSGPTAQQVIAAHMTRAPESLVQRRPAISPELEAWVMRALEKRPADRWQSADEMLARLDVLAGGARERTSIAFPGAEPMERRFRLTADVCRRLDRQTLDAGIIGGEMRFLDSQTPSDVLVYFIHGTGQDHSVFRDLMSTVPYRSVAPTLVGFEPVAPQRLALSLTTHLGLLDQLLRATTSENDSAMPPHSPRRETIVILVGFSSGGDIALQLAAGRHGDPPRVDGVISLGCNLSFETCFVTRVFRQLGAVDEAGVIDGLRRVGSDARTLEEWIKVHEYFIGTFRKFGHEVAPVRRFSDDLVRPFEERPDVFPEVYRAATARVPVVRCLWEKSPGCSALIQALRLRNLDDPSVLGEHYTDESLAVQPGADHFDLIKPAILGPHLEAVVETIRRRL